MESISPEVNLEVTQKVGKTSEAQKRASKRWADKNKERLADYKKKWGEENREKKKAAAAEYYKLNKEKLKAQSQEYRNRKIMEKNNADFDESTLEFKGGEK